MKFINFFCKTLFMVGIILLVCCASADIESSDPIAVGIMMLIAVMIIISGAILSLTVQLIKQPHHAHHHHHKKISYVEDTTSWEETMKVVENLQKRKSFLKIIEETSA